MVKCAHAEALLPLTGDQLIDLIYRAAGNAPQNIPQVGKWIEPGKLAGDDHAEEDRGVLCPDDDQLPAAVKDLLARLE